MRPISHKRLSFGPLLPWLPPVVVTAVQWYTSGNGVTLLHAALSCFLLWMPWFAYCRWQKRSEPVAPLFCVVGAAHWMSFGSLLFWGGRPSDPIYRVPFTDATLTAVLLMACLGVLSLRMGMRVPFRLVRSGRLPDFIDEPRTWHYIHGVLMVCAVAALIPDGTMGALGGLRAAMEILRSVVPHTIFAILMRRYLLGEASRHDRIAMFSYLAMRLILGVAAGWLGSAVSLGVVGIVVYISVRKRLPGKALLVIIPIVLFLQAGKEAFRQVYWLSGRTGTTTEKVMFWVEQSVNVWGRALSGSSNGDTSALLTQSFQRVSLLDQAGNVYNKTPHEVPYQLGKTYSFLLITLIPRFVWPDKPSVNEANRFYQVAYGMTTEEDLDKVSIAVGFLVESFINFGWPGVVLVMFFMGMILGLFERTMLGSGSGVLFNAIGMAILYMLISVESQAAQYIGGLAQQIGLTVVVLSPVIRFRDAGAVGRRAVPAVV